MKVLHSWLKEYVGESLPSPEKVADLLTFHAFEVEGIEQVGDETVTEVKVLASRSSDCLSHRGIARELGAILDVSLANDPFTKEYELPAGSKITITITDESLCSRFMSAVITDVKISESPAWLKQRLEALGQRSINNVVDATNYVMYGLGQPTHVLDFDKMAQDAEGRVNITIRTGKEGESLDLLSGEHIASDASILHLVDGNNQTLLDLAGIKGGKAAELTNNSTNIIVTSGNFNYQSVRKTAQKLKVFTDASNRNQNQPSPELAGYGLYETAALILELAGGKCDGVVDVYPLPSPRMTTEVSIDKTNSLLGLSLTQREIEQVLKRVGENVEVKENGFWVSSPWERTDLVIEEDYIEEISRLHGLHNITAVVPETAPLLEVNKTQYYSEVIRQHLLSRGFSEIITSSFQKKGNIQLKSALASDKGCLRESLSKNIKNSLQKNFSHLDLLGLSDVRIFEIGTVFEKTETSVIEHLSLAIGVQTKGGGYVPEDDAVLKEVTASFSELLPIERVWDTSEPGVYELNLSAVIDELPEPDNYQAVTKGTDITYKPFSAYPAISRDIALWVPASTDAGEVSKTLKAEVGELCVSIRQFDTFTKDDRTSLAFRLVFLSYERTLTDEEVNGQMEMAYQKAQSMGWEVR